MIVIDTFVARMVVVAWPLLDAWPELAFVEPLGLEDICSLRVGDAWRT